MLDAPTQNPPDTPEPGTHRSPELAQPLGHPCLALHAYPEILARAGITGRVVLKAVVDESGKVNGAEVVESSTQPAFDDAALNAVMKWRYKPALKNGKPLKVFLNIVVSFELPKQESDSEPARR